MMVLYVDCGFMLTVVTVYQMQHIHSPHLSHQQVMVLDNSRQLSMDHMAIVFRCVKAYQLICIYTVVH